MRHLFLSDLDVYVYHDDALYTLFASRSISPHQTHSHTQCGTTLAMVNVRFHGKYTIYHKYYQAQMKSKKWRKYAAVEIELLEANAYKSASQR